MSEDRDGLMFPLISANDVAPGGCLTPAYVALCGALVETPGFSERTDCPDECLCEFSPGMAYCQDCLSAAAERNHRAGIQAGGGSRVAARG